MAQAYIPRTIEKNIRRAVKQFPALIVTGPRQSGKTTLLKHLFFKKYAYVTLDDPSARLMAIEDPAIFFQNYPPPVIIDEIQYVPQLLSSIKVFIDKNRNKHGQFLLTGSQVFPLMAGVSESLAGRAAIFSLLSFSLKEQCGAAIPTDFQVLKEKVLRGGFPDVCLKKRINVEFWFSSYLQTYLERDIRQLRQIGDLSDFQRFLQLLAVLNGQILHLSNVSRDLGVAVNTVKAWISVLEASGQIITIKPFYLNKGKRIIKSPRVYFLDTGILCYLLGINSVSQVFNGPNSGQLFETVVLGEIVRSCYSRGSIPRVYWWRTSYGEEVDFVLEHMGKIIPIEVKLSAKTDPRMIKGLSVFCGLFAEKIEAAYLVNLSSSTLQLHDQVISIPVVKFIHKLYAGMR